MGRFRIFGPCCKNIPDILATPLGSQAVEISHVFKDAKPAKRWCFSHQLVILREIVWCFTMQEEHCEVELEKGLSLVHWATGDAPNHVMKSLQPLENTQEVKDGGRINFLIQEKKNFFHSSILLLLLLFSYHSYGWIIIYLLLYMIFVKIFVIAWKCKNGKPQIQPWREWRFQPIINNAKL